MAQKKRSGKKTPAKARPLEKHKREPAREKAPARKKRKIKKRFFLFCGILVLLIGIGCFFAIRAITGGEGEDAQKDGNGQQTTQSALSATSGALSQTSQGALSQTTQGGVLPAPGGEATTEAAIYDAVLNSYYISPIGQTKAVVCETFGDVTESESWNGGIYFHRQFPETMYVRYAGLSGDISALQDASVCTMVEIALEKIMELPEAFTPAAWGAVRANEENPGMEWTDYYYSIPFSTGAFTLTVFCDEKGTVWPDTHIQVSVAGS